MTQRLVVLLVLGLIAVGALAFWIAGGMHRAFPLSENPVAPPSVGSKPPASAPTLPGPVEAQKPALPPASPVPTVVVPPPEPPRGQQVAMPPASPAKEQADDIALNIRHFGQRFGGNPTGTNAEIVKALTGENEARANYLPPELRKLNDQGELIDQWGTPYFFHSDSATETEVRSAGPDRKMWTADDIVSK